MTKKTLFVGSGDLDDAINTLNSYILSYNSHIRNIINCSLYELINLNYIDIKNLFDLFNDHSFYKWNFMKKLIFWVLFLD